jgi:hypothetical protein
MVVRGLVLAALVGLWEAFSLDRVWMLVLGIGSRTLVECMVGWVLVGQLSSGHWLVGYRLGGCWLVG